MLNPISIFPKFEFPLFQTSSVFWHGRKVCRLASFNRGLVSPREWGGGVSCNETWGGPCLGKVSNVVRKEEERSDGVCMLSCPVIILAGDYYFLYTVLEKSVLPRSILFLAWNYFPSFSRIFLFFLARFYFSPGIISFTLFSNISLLPRSILLSPLEIFLPTPVLLKGLAGKLRIECVHFQTYF